MALADTSLVPDHRSGFIALDSNWRDIEVSTRKQYCYPESVADGLICCGDSVGPKSLFCRRVGGVWLLWHSPNSGKQKGL